jgi:hypothetical protein
MKKPVKQIEIVEKFDYDEIIEYIENKYNIKVRDYLNSHNHFQEYQKVTGDKMPFNGVYPDSSGLSLGFKEQWTIFKDGKKIPATKKE